MVSEQICAINEVENLKVQQICSIQSKNNPAHDKKVMQ